MKKIHNILICPLEWGLGHAGRMIPLAGKLREMDNNIFIGAGKEHLSLFRNELPGLTYINFPGFKPGYSRFLPQYIALLLKTPVLIYHIILEHFRLKKIIHENAIDIVISDNRFGLWNKKVKTVYVTHMPVIPFPKLFFFLEFIGIILHRAVMKKYSFCFIPDLPGELNLSGRLSHGIKLPRNARYIGLLSRFTGLYSSLDDNPAGFDHYTIILSGPEPQREILKQKLISILKGKDVPVLILEGKPGNAIEMVRTDNIISYNHLHSREIKEVIIGSRSIITRSGYTTIMELISLNCNALLIPTPGQTEQEYLAGYLLEKGWFTTISQKNINSGIVLPSVKSGWPREIIEQSGLLLDKALKELSEEKQEKG
ncbi:MAG: hypothetical protein MUO72_01885 [Bacteroidales bacterium]|nr:hypothetical protein [Bacteroidales bacterium]